MKWVISSCSNSQFDAWFMRKRQFDLLVTLIRSISHRYKRTNEVSKTTQQGYIVMTSIIYTTQYRYNRCFKHNVSLNSLIIRLVEPSTSFGFRT